MAYSIKIANSREIYEYAVKIRHIVFEIEQHFKEEFDDIDAYAYHAAVFEGDKLIGCGRTYVDENKKCHIGRIAVVEEYRGKNVGTFIVREMERFAVKNFDFVEFVLSAQSVAKGFYAKLGYECRGKVYFEEHCEHIEMFKAL